MIAVLLSHERSGSHLMGEFIGSCGIKMIDEVCNPNSINPLTDKKSFHRYQLDWAAENRDAFLKPTYPQRVEFVAGYFRHLKALSGDVPIAVDIKYGHLHSFEWYWNPLFRQPLFFRALQEQGIRMVHLRRKNVVEAAISSEVSKQRAVWHSWQDVTEEKRKQRHRIDPKLIVWEAELLIKQAQWIGGGWCHGLDVLHTTYEDLVASVAGNGDALARIAQFLGGTLDPAWKPKLVKLGGPLEETIENYSELVSALNQAGLGEYLAA